MQTNEEIAAYVADASNCQRGSVPWHRIKRRAWQMLNEKDIAAAKARGEGDKYVIIT